MKRLAVIAICVVATMVIAIVVWRVTTQEQRQLRYTSTNLQVKTNVNDIVHGSDTALLSVYLYLSYGCPHCRNFLNYDLPLIQEQFIDNGKVRIVLKPVELRENIDMLNALQLQICMHNNGMHDDITELLQTETTAVYTDEFRTLIDDILVQNPELAECLVSDNFATIKQNNTDFISLDTKLTPIFVIGGHVYKGRRKLEQFVKILNYELDNCLTKKIKR